VKREAVYYREKAAQCRRLVSFMTTEDIIEKLEKLAAEFDAKANAIEPVLPDQ